MTEKTLNRQIAEALGWTNLYDAEWVDDCQPFEQRLTRALCGTSPDGQHDCIVPDYEHSVDAVLAELPEDGAVEFSWGKPIDDYALSVRVVRGSMHYHPLRFFRGATRAEAAARALLAYAQWKQAQA